MDKTTGRTPSENQLRRAIDGHIEAARRLHRLLEDSSGESWTEYHNRRFREMMATPRNELV